MDENVRFHVWESASSSEEVVVEIYRKSDNKYLGCCILRREDAAEFCEQFIYFLIRMKEL